MSPLRIALWTSLRSLLRPGRFFALILATLLLFLFLLLPVAGSEGGIFASRIEILRVSLLFPGILVALGLRQAWPALGPEDEAQVWLHLLGARAWPARLGAMLGGVTALLVLLTFQALLFGLTLNLLPGRPDFRRAASLQTVKAPGGETYLVNPGDAETFNLPASPSTRRAATALLLKPLWSLGPSASIEVEILASQPDGQWQSLGLARFKGAGEVQRLALPESLPEGLSRASQLQIRRRSKPGTMISLALGEILLLGPRLDPMQTGLRAALPYLPWALLLLLAGLALCALLPPGLWGLAVLCLLPLVGLAPGLGLDRTGPHLGQGLSSLPSIPGLSTILVGLSLLAMGLFMPRRVRMPEVKA